MAEEKDFTPNFKMSGDLLDRMKEAGRPRERGQGFDAVASLGSDAMDLAMQETDTGSVSELLDKVDYEKRLKEGKVEADEIEARGGDVDDLLTNLQGHDKLEEEKASGVPEAGSAVAAAGSAVKMRSPLKQRQDGIKNLIKKTFGRGFKTSAQRGSIFGKKTFADFQDPIKQKQQEFLDAQKTDESTLNKIADLSELSGSLQSMKKVMEEAGKIHRGVGWSKHLLEDRHDLQWILDEVADGNRAKVDVDENNSVGFNISMPDGSSKRVTENDINDILLNHINPTVKANEAAKEFAELDQLGYNGRLPFDFESQFKVNRDKINKDNLGSYLKDPIFGNTSFIQAAEEDGRWKNLNTTADAVYSSVLENGDPKLTEQTIDEVARFQTALMQNKYNGGVNRKKQEEKELRGESTSSTEATTNAPEVKTVTSGGSFRESSPMTKKTGGMTATQKIEYYRNL
mgnify:CR=1 FL=1